MSNEQINWEERSYEDTTLVLSDEERLTLERRTAADMAAYHAEALNEGGIPVHPGHQVTTAPTKNQTDDEEEPSQIQSTEKTWSNQCRQSRPVWIGIGFIVVLIIVIVVSVSVTKQWCRENYDSC